MEALRSARPAGSRARTTTASRAVRRASRAAPPTPARGPALRAVTARASSAGEPGRRAARATCAPDRASPARRTMSAASAAGRRKPAAPGTRARRASGATAAGTAPNAVAPDSLAARGTCAGLASRARAADALNAARPDSRVARATGAIRAAGRTSYAVAGEEPGDSASNAEPPASTAARGIRAPAGPPARGACAAESGGRQRVAAFADPVRMRLRGGARRDRSAAEIENCLHLQGQEHLPPLLTSHCATPPHIVQPNPWRLGSVDSLPQAPQDVPLAHWPIALQTWVKIPTRAPFWASIVVLEQVTPMLPSQHSVSPALHAAPHAVAATGVPHCPTLLHAS